MLWIKYVKAADLTLCWSLWTEFLLLVSASNIAHYFNCNIYSYFLKSSIISFTFTEHFIVHNTTFCSLTICETETVHCIDAYNLLLVVWSLTHTQKHNCVWPGYNNIKEDMYAKTLQNITEDIWQLHV